MYITGNPNLRNHRLILFNPSYTLFVSNSFNFSAFSSYFQAINRPIETYELYNDGQSLLRTYVNDGNYISSIIGLTVNWKLLNGRLQFSSRPRQSIYHSSGIYNKTCKVFSVDLQATYYIGNVYVIAYCQTPRKNMAVEMPRITRSRTYYNISLGWSDNNWNIKASAINLFNRGYRATTAITESPLYTNTLISYGTMYHPCLSLSMTYTFGYGKKVQRNNEVGGQAGASSAILK